jgi:cell division protein FtsN
MPTMARFRVGHIALFVALAALAACSREQQDWRSAESADSSEAWAHFVEQHPDSELASQARARMAQLVEQRDWQHADSLATADAYRAFLAQHPTGRLAEEARIHIEAFALGSAPRTGPPTKEQSAAWGATSGVRALQLATAPSSASAQSADSPQSTESSNAPTEATDGAARAVPGEAAQPLPAAPVTSAASGAVETVGYGVQLGAFDSQASADREWQRLQGRFGAELGGLSPRIVLASTNSGPLYRLQAPAAGEAQARAICDSLKGQDQACVPVVPR